MINNKPEIMKTNLGIQLLRILLCYWIVTVHCSYIKLKHQKYLFRGFHVPTFFFLAFYFYYPMLSERNIIKITKRFQRLLIPYIFWPSIKLALIKLPTKLFDFRKYKLLTLKDLLKQFIIGLPVHGLFWFHFNLIFESLFFAIISFLFKSKFLQITHFFAIFFIYLHVSRIHFNYLNCFRRKYISNLESLIELSPLSIIGLSFGSINLLKKIKNIPSYFRIILLFLIILIFRYDIFKPIPGFKYPDIFIYTSASLLLIIFFGSFYLDKSKLITILINNISRFSGGIYYIHTIISHFSINGISFTNNKNYFSAFLIFIICFFICFLGNRLFKNNNLKYIFI